MKNIYFVFMLLFLHCKSDDQKIGTIIQGDVKDLPDGLLYIESKDSELPFMDSVSVAKNKFVYRNLKNQESITVKLYFFDNAKIKRTLSFVDPVKSTNVINQLILENGTIFITGDTYKKLNLEAPNENKLFLSYMQQGVISDYNTYNPDGTFKTNQIIKENPKSLFLLRQLYAQKVLVNLSELKIQFGLFDRAIDSTIIGKKMINYITSKDKINSDSIDETFIFSDTTGLKINLKDHLNQKKLNLYVFWASWCLPCREEIPELKKFNKTYQNTVSMTSLSIDSDYNAWKNAVKQENMPWLNISSLPENPPLLKEKFFINSVPYLVLVDNAGKKLISVTNNLDSIEKYILKIR